MARAVQMKRGNVIKLDGELWQVTDTQQTFTGKHGAYIQMKLTNMSDGHVETRRFSSSQDVEKAYVTSETMQYLYQDGPSYVFMKPETGDQTHLGEGVVKDVLPYLAYNAQVSVQLCEGRAISVSLPASVVLEVTHTEPAARGDTATSVTKPAELETGLTVKVPGHVKVGDRIQVDTRSGEFLGRA